MISSSLSSKRKSLKIHTSHWVFDNIKNFDIKRSSPEQLCSVHNHIAESRLLAAFSSSSYSRVLDFQDPYVLFVIASNNVKSMHAVGGGIYECDGLWFFAWQSVTREKTNVSVCVCNVEL